MRNNENNLLFFRKKNRLAESLKMLERCISLEPRFVQAHLELLHITPEKDKRHTLDKLLELEPANWEHYHLYGNWLKGRGNAYILKKIIYL